MIKDYLTKERQKLVTNNYKLLMSFVANINERNVPEYLEDELISDVFFRFCISAARYKEESGFKFSTYAYYGFGIALKNVFTNKKNKIDRMYYSSEMVAEQALEVKKDKVLEYSIFDNFLDSVGLDTKDRSIIEDYYKKISRKEMCKKYKLCREAIRLRVKKSLKKIREKVIEQNLDIKDFYL